MDKMTWAEKGASLSKLGFWNEDRLLVKRSLLYTFLLGLFAHGFVLVNLSVSHDAVFDFYDALAAHQHQIGLGRILEPLYRELTASGLLMPWSTGIVAFFWLGIAVFLVCKLFHLSERMEILLTAAVMTVNISVTAIAASYTPWLAADMFALLLAVAGVYFWHLYAKQRQIKYLASGMAAIIISLSIYQCYLAVTVVLMILLSIQNLIKKDGAVKVFLDGCAGIGMIAAGGGIYYVLMKLVCSLVGTPLAEGYYDSVTNLWDNQESIVKRLICCLKEEVTHFFAKDENIYPYQAIWIVNILIFVVCACLVLRLVRQIYGKFEKLEWLLLVLLVAALPFAAYMMRLLNTSVHDLMCYSVWLLYLMPFLLLKWTSGERTSDRRFYGGIVVLLSFIAFSYIQTNNAVYVKKEVESEATLSLMTEVMAQIDQTEGYVPGETEVTFVGDISKVLQALPGTDRVKGVSGCNKPTAITYPGTYQAYFDNVLLRNVKVVMDETAEEEPQEEVQEDPQIMQMPAYPQPGYVQMIDQVVVVKWN
ncbi:MAG: glucosyltransferase domain-containing protein [Lachnospiraceae bacterium]|nr:glucosyltransferase domain-containing protein [Lachnospiraceae bacterium]